jgi:hypothetical protein
LDELNKTLTLEKALGFTQFSHTKNETGGMSKSKSCEKPGVGIHQQ